MKRILEGVAGLVLLAGCSGAIDPTSTGSGSGASTGEAAEGSSTPPSTPSSPPATTSSPSADPPATPAAPPPTPIDPPATPPSEPPADPPPTVDPPADPPPVDAPADPPSPPPAPSGVTCTATTTSHPTLGVNVCDYSVPPTETTTTETDVVVRRYTGPTPKLCITSTAVSRFTNSGSPVCLWGPNGGTAAYVGTIAVSAAGTIATVSLSGSRSVAGPCRILSMKCWGSTTITIR